MLTITNKAIAILKAAKAAQGAPADAGVRIMQHTVPNDSGRQTVTVSFTNDPAPDDEEFEQNGLRVFVQDSLVEPLEDRTLDVRNADEGPELVFR